VVVFLRREGNTTLTLLLHFAALRKMCKVDEEGILDMLGETGRLDPKLGPQSGTTGSSPQGSLASDRHLEHGTGRDMRQHEEMRAGWPFRHALLGRVGGRLCTGLISRIFAYIGEKSVKLRAGIDGRTLRPLG
jgi:hypothetical protein